MPNDDELILFMERYLLEELHCGHDTIEKFNFMNDTVYISSHAIWVIPTNVKGYLDIQKASEESAEKALRLIRLFPDWEDFYRIDITNEKVMINVCKNAIKYQSIDFDVWIPEDLVAAFCGEVGNKNFGWFEYSLYTTNPNGPVYAFNDDKELRGILMPLSEEFQKRISK